MHKTRKCPGCRRNMKLTAGNLLNGQSETMVSNNGVPVFGSDKPRAAVYYCPFCIELSRKVMKKIEELEKAEKEIISEQT